MSATTLKKINAEAKRIKARHPNMKYATAQKQAGKNFRAGKISGKKKKAGKKKTTVRVSIGNAPGSNYGGAKATYKKELTQKLGWMLATQRTARTKREKKALQPEINKMTRQLKDLK